MSRREYFFVFPAFFFEFIRVYPRHPRLASLSHRPRNATSPRSVLTRFVAVGLMLLSLLE